MSAVERASASGSSSSDDEELTSEESAAAAVEQLAALQTSLTQLQGMLAPLLQTPLQSLTQQLPALQAAKLQAALAYATNALFFIYLHTAGESTENHPVKKELERVKKYLKKISDAGAPPVAAAAPARPPTKLDKGAAARFISAQLAGQAQSQSGGAKSAVNLASDSDDSDGDAAAAASAAADQSAGESSDDDDEEVQRHANTAAAAAAQLLPGKSAGGKNAQQAARIAASYSAGSTAGAAAGAASSSSPSSAGKRSNATQKNESIKNKKKQKQAHKTK